MPIRIVTRTPPLRIPSPAARLFQQELRAYRDRKIRGRSFLIAGHRGAGKTSLVADALSGLQEESIGPLVNEPRRFLPIYIQGPSLFVPESLADGQKRSEPAASTAPADPQPQGDDAQKKKADAASTTDASKSKDNALLLAALEQIVLSLYRALVDEFAERYRKSVHERIGTDRRARRDLLERAAQLQLELDEYPGPERLREFWAAGGFLEHGVLFPPSVRPNLPPDQGLRELVALSTACEAFRRVSGTFEKAKEELKQTADQQQSAKLSGDTTGKNLIAPLVSLITGGLVGGSMAATESITATWAALSGLVAALGASAVFQLSASRSRARSFTREYTFIPKNKDVATLDRALPSLIRRVEQTGLVPIFIVDELDKVEQLYERMGRMIGQLKKFVSEEAFFCFLTNRDYFEYLQRRSLTETYPIEHTYFTDRLFVVFRPDDFHDYLDQVLVFEQDGAAASGAGAAPAAASAVAAGEGRVSQPQPAGRPDEATRERDVAQADRDVLPYVLLHRAQMHAIDVRRQIDEIRAPSDVVALAPGSVRTQLADRFDFMIQLAMRIVLDRREVRSAMEREPAFYRLAYDALYYPARRRRQGIAELDLSDDARTAFATDLTARMVSKEEIDRGAKPLELSDTDKSFLFARTRELAELLADPFALCDAIDTWESERGRRLSTAARDTLPLVLATGPLLSEDRTKPRNYRWGYDHLGRELRTERRTALGYQFDVEYELAVRLVLAKTGATDPDVRRLLHALLWIPYQLWQKSPREVVTLHLLGDDELLDAALAETPEPLRDALRLTFPRAEDVRTQLIALMDLLADPDTFGSRLVDEGLTAAYPLITREFQRHSPVAVQRADGYGWQFDLRGAPLVAGLVMPSTFERAPWEEHAYFIRLAQAALQRVTAHSIDFTTLGTGTNIVPSSPEWTQVLAAIGRLDEARGRLSAREADVQDVATVAQFATLLGRHGEVIAQALICSQIVASATGIQANAAGSPLRAGLEAISTACGLRTGERIAVAELLARMIAEARTRWPELSESIATTVPALETVRVKEWEAWIENRLRLVRNAIDPDLGSAARRAWDAWRAVLERWLAGNVSSADVSIDDVVCACGKAGPITLLPKEPSQGTVGMWSHTFTRACFPVDDEIKYVPLWVAPFALAMLGLGGSARSLSRDKVPALYDLLAKRRGEERDIVERFIAVAEIPGIAPERSVLVITRAGAASFASQWPVSGKVAMLVADDDTASRLLLQPGILAGDMMPFGHVILDGVRPSDSLPRELSRRMEVDATAQGRGILFGVIGTAGDPASGVRELPALTSVDALLAQLAWTDRAGALYLQVLGPGAAALSDPLRRWLAQPLRTARGRLRVEYFGLLGLLYRLVTLSRDVDYFASYTGVAVAAEGTVEERVTWSLDRGGDTWTQELAVQRDRRPNRLVATVGDLEIVLQPDVRGGVQLTSVAVRGRTLATRLAALLRPRFRLAIWPQEGGFHLEMSVAFFGADDPALRADGDFAQEMVEPVLA